MFERGVHVDGFVENGAQLFGEIEPYHRLLHRGVAPERHRGTHHRLQFVQIGQHAAALALVLDEFDAQPETGDGRAQVVPDGGQHQGAILHEAADAGRHGVERRRRHRHLGRAVIRQRGSVDITAEPFGSMREDPHRLGQPAHRPDREAARSDRHQHEGHQEIERMPRPRRVEVGAQVKPPPIGEAQSDHQQVRHIAPPTKKHDIVRAHQHRDRHQLHLGHQLAAQFGRRLRQRRVRRGVGELQRLVVFGDDAGEAAQPLALGEQREAAIEVHGTLRDIMDLRETLQVEPVDGMNGEPRGLHHHETDEQHERRPGREAARPEPHARVPGRMVTGASLPPPEHSRRPARF